MFFSIAMNLLLVRFSRSLWKSALISSCKLISTITSPGKETKIHIRKTMCIYALTQSYSNKTYCITNLPNDKVFMTRVLLLGPCPFSLNPFTSISYVLCTTRSIRAISVKLLVVFASLYVLYSSEPTRLYLT